MIRKIDVAMSPLITKCRTRRRIGILHDVIVVVVVVVVVADIARIAIARGIVMGRIVPVAVVAIVNIIAIVVVITTALTIPTVLIVVDVGSAPHAHHRRGPSLPATAAIRRRCRATSADAVLTPQMRQRDLDATTNAIHVLPSVFPMFVQ